MLTEFILVAVAVFLLSVLLERIIIPILKSHKVGQRILEIGPRWHEGKSGTPTMGGICFIMSSLTVLSVVAVFIAIKGESRSLIPLSLSMGLATFNGMIGFFDDYTKLVKKQNEGFTPIQKIILQSIVAAAYIVGMVLTENMDTFVHIPYTNYYIDLGIFYYVFAYLLIIGFVNSVNLTDGIDGLAGSVTAIVGAFFAVAAFATDNRMLALLSAAIIGATLGFLVYNIYPAKVFMGDTGSLFLGGIVVGAIFMLGEPLLILLVGFVYFMEALSDIIQVGVFKLSGRKVRVFKMAPIHHHFEKCGWSEMKIVAVFSLVTLICCTVAYFGI